MKETLQEARIVHDDYTLELFHIQYDEIERIELYSTDSVSFDRKRILNLSIESFEELAKQINIIKCRLKSAPDPKQKYSESQRFNSSVKIELKVIDRYNKGLLLKDIASTLGISVEKVKNILLSNDIEIVSNDIADFKPTKKFWRRRKK